MDLSDVPVVCRFLGDGGRTGDHDRVRPYSKLADETAPVRTDDTDTLRAATEEARAALDKTIEAIEAKDDKAISTVRLNLLLIGLSLTVASTVPASIRYANWFTLVGFALLVTSTFVGMWAYTYTNYTPGITADYLEEIDSAEYSEAEWLRWMTRRYRVWIRTATRNETIEARRLGRTHLLQISAVAFLLMGVITGLNGMAPADVVADGSPPAPSATEIRKEPTTVSPTADLAVQNGTESPSVAGNGRPGHLPAGCPCTYVRSTTIHDHE